MVLGLKTVSRTEMAAAKAKEMIDGVENGTYRYALLDQYWKVYSWEYNDKNPEVLVGVYYNMDRQKNMSVVTDFLQDMKQAGFLFLRYHTLF